MLFFIINFFHAIIKQAVQFFSYCITFKYKYFVISVITGCDSPNKSHTITSLIPFGEMFVLMFSLLAHDRFRNVQLILKPWGFIKQIHS